MKRVLQVLICLSMLCYGGVFAQEAEEEAFNVYTDARVSGNHYIPSGYMGDYGDIQLTEAWTEGAYSGKTCIRVNYNAKGSQGWAGVYWQNPANNWGNRKGGFDLSGKNKLTFWAKGKKGGETIESFIVGGITGKYADTDEAKAGPIILTDEWKQYTINLVGKDLSYINGGFAWSTSARLNPEGCLFYLDEIKYELDSGLSFELARPEEMPFGVYTDRASISNHYIASGWMGDYSDIQLDETWPADPHSGESCIKMSYSASASQGAGWAGIYWQYPANNWGDKGEAYDLSQAKRLIFWVRGEKGGERIAEFKIGGIVGETYDTDSASIGPIDLTAQWKKHEIDLNGKDLTNIIGGFCWSASGMDNPDGFVFYLDDIRYE